MFTTSNVVSAVERAMLRKDILLRHQKMMERKATKIVNLMERKKKT